MQVKVLEVGARDGLQNEANFVATQIKVDLLRQLIHSGVKHIEAAAFVSPKWVPQMVDGLAVLQSIWPDAQAQGVQISALVPNEKGMQTAIAAGVHEVVIFSAASETFVQKNINCSIEKSIVRFQPVVQLAKSLGKRVRGSISCCLGCPYEGEVSIVAVLNVIKQMQALGIDEIDIADTIGVGTAKQVQALMQAVGDVFPIERVAGHFHDTYGQALANVLASLHAGVNVFHSSVAGLGGCPYAKGATGNLATEDLLYFLHGIGLQTGIDLSAVAQTGAWISQQLGRSNGSRAGAALMAKK
jgi:hydroxymethylglutaryl-CoA lyase